MSATNATVSSFLASLPRTPIQAETYTKAVELISNNNELIQTAKTFPQHANGLIEAMFYHKDAFARLVTNNTELLDTYGQFPEYADALIDKLIFKPELRQKLVSNYTELRKTIGAFPNFRYTIAEFLLLNGPNFSTFISNILNSHPDLYLQA